MEQMHLILFFKHYAYLLRFNFLSNKPWVAAVALGFICLLYSHIKFDKKMHCVNVLLFAVLVLIVVKLHRTFPLFKKCDLILRINNLILRLLSIYFSTDPSAENC